jgi:hypothetical protein
MLGMKVLTGGFTYPLVTAKGFECFNKKSRLG